MTAGIDEKGVFVDLAMLKRRSRTAAVIGLSGYIVFFSAFIYSIYSLNTQESLLKKQKDMIVDLVSSMKNYHEEETIHLRALKDFNENLREISTQVNDINQIVRKDTDDIKNDILVGNYSNIVKRYEKLLNEVII